MGNPDLSRPVLSSQCERYATPSRGWTGKPGTVTRPSACLSHRAPPNEAGLLLPALRPCREPRLSPVRSP